MAFEKLLYRSAGGTITGNLAGKLMHFSARPGQGGVQPPPGNYDIHPPVNDPIYGLVALMTPSGRPNAVQALALRGFKMDAPNALKEAPSAMKEAPSGMKEAPALGFQKVTPTMQGCFTPAIKYCMTPNTNMVDGGRFATAMIGIKDAQSTPSSPVFVLSSRPILGQNSLVIMSGHADLMDALLATGGASVTVA